MKSEFSDRAKVNKKFEKKHSYSALHFHNDSERAACCLPVCVWLACVRCYLIAEAASRCNYLSPVIYLAAVTAHHAVNWRSGCIHLLPFLRLRWHTDNTARILLHDCQKIWGCCWNFSARWSQSFWWSVVASTSAANRTWSAFVPLFRWRFQVL